MATKSVSVVALAEMEPGQEADVFALLAAKEELRTREGKPYWRVTFRDARREVSFPIWNDTTFAEECQKNWQPGVCYKLRAIYRETNYGPQLEIRKLREAVPADAAEGYDPGMFLPQSQFNAEDMFTELRGMVSQRVSGPLQATVLALIDTNRDALLRLPAATRNHHAFAGGWLEHVLSVTRTAVYLADKYAEYYPDLRINRELVVAGAVLHDIGKLRELAWQPEGPCYTAEGQLIGHILQGRDMVLEVAGKHGLTGDTLLRLEHLIVAHQRLPEFGSPKPPMTPEAMLVHYADDLDAKMSMIDRTLREDTTPGPLTSKKNILAQYFYRGMPEQS